MAVTAWFWPAVALAQTDLFVVNLGSDDVSVFDADTRQVTATIPVGNDPDGIAVIPSGAEVFVANFLSDDVSIIDTQTKSVVGSVFVGSGPVGVATTPDGQTLLVANRESGTVSVVDVGSRRVMAVIPVELGPNGIAVHPSGAFAYVTNSFTRQPGVVSVIDLDTVRVITSIAVNHSPGRVAFAPDGRCAYVTNFRSVNVSVVDTTSHSVIATVPVFGRPTGVTVNPNGAYVYVATLGGRINVLDADTNQLFANIAVGAEPFAITTLPSGAFGFTADFRSGTSTVLDTVDHEVRGPLVVGQQPFAVAVACRGAQCDAPPVSPRPTRTPTNTRPATPTRTLGPSNTPRSTPTRVPAAVLQVGSGAPDENGRVSIDIDLLGRSLGGLQSDIYIDTRVLQLIGCSINPAIGLFPLGPGPENITCLDDPSIGPCKNLISATYDCGMTPPPEACPPNPALTVFRAIIAPLAAPNTNEIPPGTLFTCRLQVIDAGALPVELTAAEVIGSDVVGNRIAVEARPGQVGEGALPQAPTETPPATATPTVTRPPAVVSIDTAYAGDGARVLASVVLASHEETVGGVQNDLIFDNTILALSRTDCRINPLIGLFPEGNSCIDDATVGPCKNLSSALRVCDSASPLPGCPEGVGSDTSVFRAIVHASAAPNSSAIPDGTLYTCTFTVLDPTRLPTVLTNSFVVGSDPHGVRLNTVGVDGVVTVDAGGPSTDAVSGAVRGSGSGCQIGRSTDPAGAAVLALLVVAVWIRRVRRHTTDEWR